MLSYLVRRVLLMVPVAFLVTVAVFSLIHLIPGDPARIMLGESYTPAALAALHHRLGLDQPLPVQYLDWIGGVLQGNLGQSVQTGQPVTQAIAQRAPATLELGFAALLWSTVVAVPLGALAAARRGSVVDWLATSLGVVGVTIPSFATGLLLILVVAVGLRWLPAGGFISLAQAPSTNLRDLVLPAITLGSFSAAVTMRFTRSAMIDVLSQDYIRTARAKGASRLRVLNRHAVKNALIPILTIVGLQVGNVIQGAVVTETIFAWPGIGQLAVNSIFARDYPVIQGIVLLVTIVYMLVNLLVDAAYAVVDPRVSYA
ncbi:MAG: ABC transporter permease [Candidatus Dormiibacterota bacterium]